LIVRFIGAFTVTLALLILIVMLVR
jgi:hypothetical protein